MSKNSTTNAPSKPRPSAPRRTLRNITATFVAIGILAGGSIAMAQPAQAIICGYSLEMEEFESDFSIDIFGMTIDPFGGERQVAHWGNCSDANQRIQVTRGDTKRTFCVTPGDTRLGFTKQSPNVSAARRIGTC